MLSLCAASAGAATIAVNTTVDTLGPGVCSLREAISAANVPGTQAGTCAIASSTGPNTLVLGAGDYQISIQGANETNNQTGDLNVNDTAGPLTILGAGETATLIDGAGLGSPCCGTDRDMTVAAGVTLTLEDLTVTNGEAPGGSQGSNGANSATGNAGNGGSGGTGQNGGGILNAGTLTLDDVAVTDNRAGSGGDGGEGGKATGSTGNGGNGGDGGAAGQGGGIYNSGTLTLDDSTISGNDPNNGYVGGEGGWGGDGGNSVNGTAGMGGDGATLGDGGGIYSTGTLTVTASTIDHNFAGYGGEGGLGGSGTPGGNGGNGGGGAWGGGISSVGGSVTITDSTIADNGSGGGGQGLDGGSSNNDIQLGGNGGNGGNAGNGGGVRIQDATGQPVLLDDTIADNQLGTPGGGGEGGNFGGLAGQNGTSGADGLGGGIYDQKGPILIDRSAPAVLEDTLLASNLGTNCAGNHISDGGFNLSFDDTSCPSVTTGDPNLGALQDNGGSTQTMALGAGSAAIGQVPATGHNCTATDQRGVSRPQPPEVQCSIGAYEFAPPVCRPAAVTTHAGAAVSVTLTCADPAGVTIAYATATNPAHGALSDLDAAAGTVTYTPASGFSGTDTFTYVATSVNGTSAPASVTVTVNAPPSCQPVTATTAPAQAVAIQLHCSDATGAPVTYAAADGPAHGALSALNPTTGTVTYTPATGFSGTDTFTYVATSVNGTSAAQTVSITVTSAATPAGVGGTPGGSGGSGGPGASGAPSGSAGGSVPAATARPVITNARMTNRRFRVARGATALSARRLPRGSAFAFRLSTPARLQIALSRSLPGRRAGRRCVAPTRALVRVGAKSCTRVLAAGILTRTLEPAGADSVAFSGRIGTRALATGSYQASLQAANSAGSSKATTLAFAIIG
ncbi:MAG: Ig-like domain-containing protein [Solirubrobacteraceae bacterium]